MHMIHARSSFTKSEEQKVDCFKEGVLRGEGENVSAVKVAYYLDEFNDEKNV